jgi:lipoprotein
MKLSTTLLSFSLLLLCGCTSENEELPRSVANKHDYYFVNDGKSIKELPVKDMFPWLSPKAKNDAFEEIEKGFTVRNTRAIESQERKVVAYGYQSIVRSTKPHKVMFRKEKAQDLGLSPGIYIISEHTVKQTFACTPNKEITPFPGYNNSKDFKYKMGLLGNFWDFKRGFETNLTNNVTSSDRFEGTTILIKIHSDLWGRRGYKEWWPCSPDQLVWIYKESDNTFDWGIN